MRPLTVREYLRVSKDVQQSGRSPNQQHAENARAVHEQGWVLSAAPPYRDDDRSASRYARRPREDFKRLIVDLESGLFQADVLAIWESSRGSRRVGEWVDLVDLCKSRGVRIWVTTHGRLYDPSNARDRRSLLEDAVDAEYESDKTSERRRRSARASAEEGRPHGRNLYGYRRVYDQETGRLLRVEPHPEQAPIVQEAARRVLSGDPMYAIARDFNLRGVRPREGTRTQRAETLAWFPAAVRQMLRVTSYAGKRAYGGEIVGDAVWPALIEYEDWKRLQSVMSARWKENPRDLAAKYLLSGIAKCGECDGALTSARHSAEPRRANGDGSRPPLKVYINYACAGVPGRAPNGVRTGWHTAMKASVLDDIVVTRILEQIKDSGRGRWSHRRGDTKVDEERRRLVREIAEHESYLRDVREQAASIHRFDLLADQEARLRPTIAAARRRLESLAPFDPLVSQLAHTGDMRASWMSLPIADQRRIVRSMVTPIVHRVTPEWRGSRRVNTERVELRWR